MATNLLDEPAGAAKKMAGVRPGNQSPGNIYPYNQPTANIYGRSPTPAKPASPSFMPGTRAVFNESGNAIGNLASQGKYAAAAGETARAALAYVPAVVDDVVGGAVRTVGPSVMAAGKQFLGIGDGTPSTPTQTAAQTMAQPTPAAQPLPKPAADRINALGNDAMPTEPSQSSANQPSPGAVNVARQANGTLEFSGQNVSGPVSYNAGSSNFKPSGAGVTSVPAVSALAQMPESQAQAQPQVGSYEAPNSSNSWQARNNLRNLEVSASSIMNKGTRSRPSTEQLAYQKALEADIASVGGMDPGTIARTQADASRYGADQRLAGDRMNTIANVASNAQRNNLAAQELGLKREAQGIQTRAALQQEALRNTLVNPNATPEQRRVAQRSLSALSGKSAADRLQVVNLPDSTNDMGVVMKGGQDVVRFQEDGTVERVPVASQGRAPAAAATPKVGATQDGYRFKGGNPSDPKSWEKM